MRTEQISGLHPDTLVADTASGAGSMPGRLSGEQAIKPHIPVFDRTERGCEAFPATAFAFDHVANEYTRPGGKKLKTCGCEIRHYTSKHDSSACPLKPHCTPGAAVCKIAHHPHQEA